MASFLLPSSVVLLFLLSAAGPSSGQFPVSGVRLETEENAGKDPLWIAIADQYAVRAVNKKLLDEWKQGRLTHYSDDEPFDPLATRSLMKLMAAEDKDNTLKFLELTILCITRSRRKVVLHALLRVAEHGEFLLDNWTITKPPKSS